MYFIISFRNIVLFLFFFSIIIKDRHNTSGNKRSNIGQWDKQEYIVVACEGVAVGCRRKPTAFSPAAGLGRRFCHRFEYSEADGSWFCLSSQNALELAD